MERQYYAIRLDGTDYTKLKEYMDKDGGAYFIVREGGEENPHFHGLIYSVKKLPAFRSGFVRAVLDGAHGNGAYSLTKVKDLDKYERYMCKGESMETEPDVVATNGIQYTDEWVAGKHEEYWSVNAEIMRKRAALSVHDAALQACKDAHVVWNNRPKIAELYIRELVARGKGINIFATKSAVNLIQIELCPDDQALLELAGTV